MIAFSRDGLISKPKYRPTSLSTFRRVRISRLVTILFCATNRTVYSKSVASRLLNAFSVIKNTTMADTIQEASSSDPWSNLGGGAINEKKRRHGQQQLPQDKEQEREQPKGFSPSSQKSHLMHAIEGLDRYPNYLSRWSLHDMDRLDAALQEQVAKVREQRKAIVERRQDIQQLVDKLVERDIRWKKLLQAPASWQEVRERILDPAAAQAIFRSNMFTNRTVPPPDVGQVINGKAQISLDASKLSELLDEEMYDVFSFRLLALPFCKEVREYVKAMVQLEQETNHDSFLGRRPIDLDAVGLGWLNSLLFHLIVRPVSRHLFQSSETQGDLDWRQGYVAGYSAQPGEGKPRERLVTHTDDSEVTLNVCLGEEGFEGGLLEFRGLRGTDSQGELIGTFQPQPGLALLHAGRHFHHVTQVTSGDRFAYILWARSWQGIRSETCPCCWLNRRQDSACVCGQRWN